MSVRAPVFTRDGLEALGFGGFVTFAHLLDTRLAAVTREGGIYAVLRVSEEPPTFLAPSPGGRFKGKDPTVALDVLEAKWVEGCPVVYIGKGDKVQRRLGEFARFGRGEPIGHWGGRYVWQLTDSADLLVAWQRCEEPETPIGAERELLAEFVRQYGRLPFANLRRS